MSTLSWLAKIFLWVSSGALALSLFLLPLLLAPTSHALYAKGYGANGAYENHSYEYVWNVTAHVQSFFRGENGLMDFPPDEEAHLEEVKALFSFGWTVFVCMLVVFALSLCLYISFLYQEHFGAVKGKIVKKGSRELFAGKDSAQKKFFVGMLARVLRNAGFILGAFILIVSVLASSWNWFFFGFHRLFFSGQWMFEMDTLMMQLWGGNFFVATAIFVAIRMLQMSCLLLALSFVLESVRRKVVS